MQIVQPQHVVMPARYQLPTFLDKFMQYLGGASVIGKNLNELLTSGPQFEAEQEVKKFPYKMAAYQNALATSRSTEQFKQALLVAGFDPDKEIPGMVAAHQDYFNGVQDAAARRGYAQPSQGSAPSPMLPGPAGNAPIPMTGNPFTDNILKLMAPSPFHSSQQPATAPAAPPAPLPAVDPKPPTDSDNQDG